MSNQDADLQDALDMLSGSDGTPICGLELVVKATSDGTPSGTQNVYSDIGGIHGHRPMQPGPLELGGERHGSELGISGGGSASYAVLGEHYVLAGPRSLPVPRHGWNILPQDHEHGDEQPCAHAG